MDEGIDLKFWISVCIPTVHICVNFHQEIREKNLPGTNAAVATHTTPGGDAILCWMAFGRYLKLTVFRRQFFPPPLVVTSVKSLLPLPLNSPYPSAICPIRLELHFFTANQIRAVTNLVFRKSMAYVEWPILVWHMVSKAWALMPNGTVSWDGVPSLALKGECHKIFNLNFFS